MALHYDLNPLLFLATTSRSALLASLRSSPPCLLSEQPLPTLAASQQKQRNSFAGTLICYTAKTGKANAYIIHTWADAAALSAGVLSLWKERFTIQYVI